MGCLFSVLFRRSAELRPAGFFLSFLMPADPSVSLSGGGSLLQIHAPEDGVLSKPLLDFQHGLQLCLLPGQFLAAVLLRGGKEGHLRFLLLGCFPAVQVRPQGQAALQKALSPAFAAQARQAKSPYNGGDTSGRIVRRLEAFVQSPSLGKPKLFYDGPVPGWEKEGSR